MKENRTEIGFFVWKIDGSSSVSEFYLGLLADAGVAMVIGVVTCAYELRNGTGTNVVLSL